MIALSIRQPWAWMILHAGKDIENRDWPTAFVGRCLLHAGLTMTRAEYAAGRDVLRAIHGPKFDLPPADELRRGGIVGSVVIRDCVLNSNSPWFAGPFGFQLVEPWPCPFTPLKGRLQFFNAPKMELLPPCEAARSS